MNDATAVVGVDMGTTSTKAVAYDRNGQILAREAEEYPLRSPLPGRAEQDPEEIFEAVLGCVSKVARTARDGGARVGCVSFSAAMHSLMALDEDGRPVTPSLTYADGRASEQAARIKADLDGLAIYGRTGTPIHPMSPLAKLLWFREEEPETFDRAARWVSVKEYVFSRLFGEFVADHSIASASGLFNLEKSSWDAEVLEMLGLPEQRLSRLVPTTHVIEDLDREHAGWLGLDPGTPFVVGANDGALANLGVGAFAPGVVACSIGTSGAVRSVVEEPRVDEGGRLFCYALAEKMWVIGGPINNGGLALAWLRDSVLPELSEAARSEGRDPHDLMEELAGRVPAGSEGVIFLPYLTGERAPQWNPDARAVYFGLTRGHGREHLIRAVLEGVVYQMRAVARVLEEATGEPEEVRATGGFARSALWRQVMADVFRREILFPESPESSCLGAALLGMKALGLVDTLEAGERMIRISHRHSPDSTAARAYEAPVEIFTRLYDQLEPEFEAVSRAQHAPQ